MVWKYIEKASSEERVDGQEGMQALSRLVSLFLPCFADCVDDWLGLGEPNSPSSSGRGLLQNQHLSDSPRTSYGQLQAGEHGG